MSQATSSCEILSVGFGIGDGPLVRRRQLHGTFVGDRTDEEVVGIRRPLPASNFGAFGLPGRPHRQLVLFCHRRLTFVHELLNALSFIGFRRVDVAL